MARRDIRTDIVAKDKTKKAFASVRRAMKSLKKGALAVGVAVAALGAGLLAAAKKAVNFGDEIAKTADKVGFSTTALQELRVAADLAGISQGELDSGLGALSKRMGELRQETGALKTFLDKSDPALKTLLQGTTDNEQAFRIIIATMDRMTNAQDKAALAAAALGRSLGVAASKLSLQELDAGIARAREMGLIIDEKLLRNAEKIKDEFSLAARAFEVAFVQEMLKALSGIDMKQAAKDLVELGKAAFKAARGIAEFLGLISEPASERLAAMRKEATQLTEELARLELKLGVQQELGAGTTQTRATIELVERTLKGINQEMQKLQKVSKEKPLEVTITKFKEAGKAANNATNEFKGATFALEELKTPLAQFAESAGSIDNAFQNAVVGGLTSFEDTLLSIGDSTKSLSASFKEMASSIIKDLQRMMIRKFVTGPLGGFLDQQLSVFSLSSLFGGPSFASGFHLAPALGFADGGYAAGGRPAIVGERGPELIVPGRRGATVYPNESLGGSVNINQNFDFSGANPATLSLLQQEAERIKNETFVSVFQAIDRGGNYAKISGRR